MITTVGGALIGFGIGQQFNGTTLPFLIGFTSCGAAALAVAHWANRPPAEDSHSRREEAVQETISRPA
jgi:DHA1 family bicyclomycin/chloramphenicol resistance-like MFS transporter